MLAGPGEALTPEELESNAVANIATDLGPTRQLEVDGFDEDGSEGERVSMILLDWPQALYQFLKRSENPVWPADTIWPHAAEGVYRNLDLEELVAVAHAWVEAGDLGHSEAYATALEAPATAPPPVQSDLLQQLLEQVQVTASAVTQLQGEMAGLKKDSPASSRDAPPQREPRLLWHGRRRW